MAAGRGEESAVGAQTVVRALGVLDLLRESGKDLGVSEVARQLSINITTAHRTLRALTSAGYVAQDPETDRYRLGRQAYLLGVAAGRNLGLTAVTGILERVRDETGESANLVVRDGDEGLVVLRVESGQPLRFTQDVGTRIPLYCTSSGKVLLAFAPDPAAALDGLELARMTTLTQTSRTKLLRELAQIRETGFSINRGERIPGVCGVAAPVFDSDGVLIAAVAVQGPEVRLGEDRYAALGATMRDVAADVGAALPGGYGL